MIDTHAHLNFPDLAADLDGVLDRAQSAGVEHIIVPAVDIASSTSSIELSKKYSNISACVGLHPSDVKADWQETKKALEELLYGDEYVTSIGEVGLDYYHYEETGKEHQQAVFRAMIQMAIDNNLPLIVHSREAFTDTYNILKDLASNHPVVVHCFYGSKEEAEAWLDLGFHLSLTGILTFKKNGDLRVVAKNLPLDRIMLETDAPYLAPEGFRGQTCEPLHLMETARCLAEIRGLTVDQIDEATTATALEFFRLG